MAFAGLRGTGDYGTDERPKNFRELILWRQPNGMAPLTALLSKMGSESTDDPEFSWWEEELNQVRLQISYTTGFSTTDTSLTVSVSGSQNGLDLVAGDLLMVEEAIASAAYAPEIVVVSAITSSSVIVVSRGAAGTSSNAAPIANNTYLTKIGNTFSEGSTSPTVSNRNPTKFYNYCQIFKTAYELTNTTKKTRTRTGDPLKNDRKRKMFDHSVALELAFLFGTRSETNGANNKPQRTTAGILAQLAAANSSSIYAFATTPTANLLIDNLYSMWDYQSEAGSERIAFCGNGALNTLNKVAHAATNTRINFDGYVNVYGMKLMRWVFPQGEIYLKSHPLFNTHGRFTNDMLVIDPSVLKYRYLRDTDFQDNIQANDADTQKGQWLTEAGLELHHAKTCKWLSNMTYP